MKTIYTSKIWLFVAIAFSALISKAQNDLDATFGNNGSIFRTTVANSQKVHSGFSTILNSDNTLNFVERTPATTAFPNDNRVYVNKLNSTGTLINSYLVGGGTDDITHVFYDKFSNGEQILVTTRTYGSGNIFGDKTTNLHKLSTNGIRVGGSEKIVYTQVNTTAKYLKYQALCGVIRDGGSSALIGGVLQERGTTTTWNGSQYVLNQPGPLGFISSIDQTTMDPFTLWGTGGGMLTISGIVSVSSITRAGSNYFFQAQTTVVGSNRLYKISNNGTIVNAFGGGSGFISVPGGAFVADANGDIFITLGNTIKKYNGTSGALVTGWADSGIAATTVTGVVGSQGTKVLSIDNSGRLLMASRSGNATLVLRYAASGSIDPAFSGNGYGLFNNFFTIAVNQIFADANGDVYVTGTSIPTGHEGYRAIIYKFKSSIPIPIINISVSSLSAFTATYPNISSLQLFSVSGQFLGNSLTVTSSIPYEISANGSTYSNSLIFAPLLGSVPLSKVFVRLKAGSNAGVTNSFVNCSSNGTPSKSVSLSATIAKSNLTLTAANVSRAYNTSNPVFLYVASGLINGDNVGVINGQVGFSTTAIQSSNVGAYTIIPVTTTVTAANYNIIAANGTLTITKINPTINITSANTGTQGNAIALAFNSNSPATGTWSFVAGSGASLSGSTLNLTAAGFVRVRLSQVSGTNYNAGFFEQQVDIVGLNAPSIVCPDVTTIPSAFPVNSLQLQYNSNSPGVISFSVVSSTGNGMGINNLGLINVAFAGEGLIQISQNASAPFSAGTKFVKVVINKIKANEISVLSRNNSPFNLPDNNTFYSIDDFYTDEYASLVVSGPNGSARTYSVVSGSGYIAGTFNNRLYSTIPGVVRVRVTAPETNSVEALDVERDFVAYPLFVTFEWNYTQKDVVYGNSALDISYTFKNPPTKFTFNNIISSTGTNLVSLIDNTLLGINKPGTVVIQGVSPAGGIYREANSTGTITIDIAKRALGATPQTIFREYGESNPTEVGYSYVNLLPGDEDKIISHPSPLFGTNVSSNADTYSYGSNMFAFESDYYTATVSGSGSQQIRKAQLNIKVDNKEITYGQALPTFTYSITGFKLGQNSGVISGTPSLGVGSLSGVGIYRINITTSGLSATNYNFESETGTLIVNPATLTITGINATKSYGSANPTFTYSVSGFLNGDNASVITGTPIFSTSATNGSSSGAYTISINGESMSSTNYNLVFITGALTVNKVSLTVSASSSSRAYGVSNPSFTANITGFVNGDNNSLVTGSASLTTAAITSSNAGTYIIVSAIGNLSAVNYNFSFTNGVLTVTKVSLNASPASTSRVYGNANPTFTANYTGFVNSENAAVLNGAPSITTTALQTSAVGTYPINFAIGTLNATNYTFNTSNAVLTITRANLTVTALNANKVYGQNNPAFVNSITGFKNSETESVIGGSAVLTSSATAISDVNTYSINVNVNGMSASNYNFVGNNGTLTITKANRAITITSPNVGRNGTVVTITSSVNPSGTVSWSVLNGTGTANISGNQLTLSSFGIVTIVGTIAADINFNVASTSQVFNITNLTVPSISFENIAKTFTDAPFQLNATSNSTANLVYSVISSTPLGIVQVSTNGVVTLIGAGSATLQVSQIENGGFSAISQSTQLTVGKKLVGIQFDMSDLTGSFGEVLTFSGTPVAGNPTIIWSLVNLSGSASISGNNLLLLSEGTVQLTATINENVNYQENVAFRLITITGLKSTLLVLDNLNKTFGDAPFSIAANSNSTASITYSLVNSSDASKVNLSSSGQVTILGTGNIQILASQLVGNGFEAATATGIITVLKRNRIIAFVLADSDTVGNSISLPNNIPNLVWNIAQGTGTAIILGNSISLTGVGLVTITGTIDEDNNYLSYSFVKEIRIIFKNTVTSTFNELMIYNNVIQISLYPNPTSDFVSIVSNKKIDTISIFDISGHTLQTISHNVERINISDLANGAYLLKVYLGNEVRILKFNKH